MSLLEELKNYLDITWEDEGTDKKLGGILNRAQNILSEYAGEALSFDSDQETEKQPVSYTHLTLPTTSRV